MISAATCETASCIWRMWNLFTRCIQRVEKGSSSDRLPIRVSQRLSTTTHLLRAKSGRPWKGEDLPPAVGPRDQIFKFTGSSTDDKYFRAYLSLPPTSSSIQGMKFRLRRQPLKALYQAYLLTSVIFRLPVWFVTSLFPSWRPRPTWGFRRVLVHNLLRLLVESFFETGLPALDTSPRATSMLEGYVEVEPVPASLVVGEIDDLASRNNVRPERIHGYWYGPAKNSGSGGKVIYFFHCEHIFLLDEHKLTHLRSRRFHSTFWFTYHNNSCL